MRDDSPMNPWAGAGQKKAPRMTAAMNGSSSALRTLIGKVFGRVSDSPGWGGRTRTSRCRLQRPVPYQFGDAPKKSCQPTGLRPSASMNCTPVTCSRVLGSGLRADGLECGRLTANFSYGELKIFSGRAHPALA